MFLGHAAARLRTPSMTKRCTVASDLNWTTGSSDLDTHSHTENHRAVIARERRRTETETSLLTRAPDDAFLFLCGQQKAIGN